ncbi:Uncharacterized protein FKW44_015433 [Caligus rogercresseyi]|uniref:Uncharacterized protein n=1 Tax=Caligus rogercresseyi TaxID=217165 RepID=A0A7T8K0F6_CALRO|nr:Uncharacterized protein FKW44_015433 [Caligus rogercresseyi]
MNKSPLLTPKRMAVHLLSCQRLLNDLKSAPAKRVIILIDEKTWTVDPVRNKKRPLRCLRDIDGNDHPANGVGRHTHVLCVGRHGLGRLGLHGRFDVFAVMDRLLARARLPLKVLAGHEGVIDIVDSGSGNIQRKGDLRRGAARKEHPCNLVPTVTWFAHLMSE